MASKPLAEALAALRSQPGIDLHTLRAVDAILAQFAGQRVTVLKGHKRVERLDMAKALIPDAATRSEAVLMLCRGLGCSRATGYRLLHRLGHVYDSSCITQDPLKK